MDVKWVCLEIGQPHKMGGFLLAANFNLIQKGSNGCHSLKGRSGTSGKWEMIMAITGYNPQKSHGDKSPFSGS